MAMNTAGLAGANRVGVGVGGQNGESALAVVWQRAIRSRNRAQCAILPPRSRIWICREAFGLLLGCADRDYVAHIERCSAQGGRCQ
ncbi:hypothetical protein [Luteimonas notoginsengisoli]|jgi:hypothetical protein|uniref:Uncharacterized protein n=1 Tax=Luteimonas notoginsengisoli TaxID=1578200 RepID=A0ABV7UWN8_9GAMM